jgi:hypothetical protein
MPPLETTLIKTTLSKLSLALILNVVCTLAANLVYSIAIEDANVKQVCCFNTAVDSARFLLFI